MRLPDMPPQTAARLRTVIRKAKVLTVQHLAAITREPAPRPPKPSAPEKGSK